MQSEACSLESGLACAHKRFASWLTRMMTLETVYAQCGHTPTMRMPWAAPTVFLPYRHKGAATETWVMEDMLSATLSEVFLRFVPGCAMSRK